MASATISITQPIRGDGPGGATGGPPGQERLHPHIRYENKCTAPPRDPQWVAAQVIGYRLGLGSLIEREE